MTEMRMVRRRTTLPSAPTPTEPVGRSRLIHGDSIEVLRGMESNSIDSIVTDPPYELGFMGRKWDGTGIAYSVDFWAECLRVLKPGGYLLAFGATRTYHRMVCAIEDADFEIRDSIHWVYGSGFPKSLDVSKAIDKAAGAEREVIGNKLNLPGYHLSGHDGGEAFGHGLSSSTPETRLKSALVTAPATDAAKQWEGFGTALKPSHEPVVVARKPLVGTVVSNVLEFGTGGLNIDGCRVEHASEADREESASKNRHADFGTVPGGNQVYGDYSMVPSQNYDASKGRWPTNLLLDEHAAAVMDADNAPSTSKKGKPRGSSTSGDGWGMTATGAEYDDAGGVSRFFPVFKYQSKPSPKERAAGLDGKNVHPTVKPIELMRWLVRLVTPPNGVVLDPFLGSGTTAIAASLEGFDFVGIEREAEYAGISTKRLIHYGAKFETIVHQSSENVA